MKLSSHYGIFGGGERGPKHQTTPPARGPAQKIAQKKRSKIPPQSAPIFKFFRFFCKIPRFVLFMGQFFCYGENSTKPANSLVKFWEIW